MSSHKHMCATPKRHTCTYERQSHQPSVLIVSLSSTAQQWLYLRAHHWGMVNIPWLLAPLSNRSGTHSIMILQLAYGLLSHEDHKYNKEDNEDSKYLYHEPSVVCHRLEVLQKFTVGSLHIQLGILNIVVNSARKANKRT